MTDPSWPRFHTGIPKSSINLWRDYQVPSHAGVVERGADLVLLSSENNVRCNAEERRQLSDLRLGRVGRQTSQM